MATSEAMSASKRPSGLFEQHLAAAETRRYPYDLGELASGGGVGGEEAGCAGQDERALLAAVRPRPRLSRRRLDHLEPVELGVLGEQRVAEGGDRLSRGSTAAQEAVDDPAGSVDVPLLVP